MGTKGYIDLEVKKGFNYVLVRQKPQRIAFGSAQERQVLPIIKGLSGFMRLYTSEYLPKLGPQLYDTSRVCSAFASTNNKKWSTKGVSSLASTAPRFVDNTDLGPPCTRYEVAYKWVSSRHNKAPFNSGSERISHFPDNNPGPGSYPTQLKQNRGIPMAHTLGGPMHIVPGVETKCVPYNLDKCEMCERTPLGDYWQNEYTNFLCLDCMSDERKDHYKYTNKQLDEYKLIRDCSFMHKHDGTTAAIKILPDRAVNKKRKVETYLCEYFTDYQPQPILYPALTNIPDYAILKHIISFHHKI